MAYKVLYLQSSTTDIQKLLLRHQRYIVQLSGAKQCEAAFIELWTASVVLQGSKKFDEFSLSSWPLLLAGISTGVEANPSVIISHHFLVLQTILQYLSANLQSVVKKTSKMTLSVFQEVAQVFLRSSNHQSWIRKFSSDATAYRKYKQNTAKIIGGFLKVANFIKHKIPPSETLDLGLSLLELKSLEISLQLGDLQDKSLVDVRQSPATAPFFDDLEATASAHFAHLPDLNAFYLTYSNKPVSPATTELALTIPERIGTLMKGPDLAKVTNMRNLPDTLNALDSFPQLLKESLNPKLETQTLGVILRHLLKNTAQLESSSKVARVLDKIVSHSKHVTTEIFSVLLEEVLSPLSNFYIASKQTARCKNIAKLCFSFPLIPESLHLGSKLDLWIFTQQQSKLELPKLKLRTEYSICKLVGSGAFDKGIDLFVQCRRLFPEGVTSPPIVSSLVDCMLHSVESIPLLLLKQVSNNEIDTALYNQVFDEIVSKGNHKTSLIRELIKFYRPEAKEARIRQLYGASIMSHDPLDEIPYPNFSSSTELLYAAGIHTFEMNKAGKLYESHLAFSKKYLMKWIVFKKTEVENDQEDIFITILHELFYSSHFQMVVLLIEDYTKVAGSSNASQVGLNLMILLCRAKMENLDTPGTLDTLRKCGFIMKEMNSTEKPVKFNQVIGWKLLQFDYFILMNDIFKSNEKFDEIKSILSSKPGYGYQDEQVELPLEQRFENFLILAQFLILSTKLNMASGNYMTGLKNIKLSIKLLNSVLRKLDLRGELRRIRKDTEYHLLQSYRMAFHASRHLGLSKDAIYYVNELNELNQKGKYPVFKAFYSFELSNYFTLIGRDEESWVQYSLGSGIIDNLHFRALKLSKSISALFSRVLKAEKEEEAGLRDGKSQLECEMKIYYAEESSTTCLAPKYLNESVLDLEYSFLKRFSEKPQIDCESDRRKMLLKTILDVQHKINKVELSHPLSSNLRLNFKKKVLPSSTHPNFFSEEISRKLIDCKEILLKYSEKENSTYLSVNQLFDVSNLLACCVFNLSFVSAMKELMAKNLLESMHFLQDLAKNMPNINQRFLYSSDAKSIDLLPSNEFKGLQSYLPKQEFGAELKKLLPSSWIVVSLDICQLTGSFVVSKFDSRGNSPIYYKLQAREKSGFTSFRDILVDLDRIIKDSNASTKNSVTALVKTKEDRRNWWKLRFGLDQRLKDLLDIVESELLGGFKGIFNSVDSLSKDYEKFKTCLIRLWRQFTNPFTGPELSIGTGIIDLYYTFIFSDAESHDHHFHDLISYTFTELTGKPNLSDVPPERTRKLMNDIRKLYSNRAFERSEHIILIPSKACASFPWESMNCLRNKSVSRMPSMGQLLQLLESQKPFPKAIGNKIFYLVNPGKDLQKTQAEFGPIFENLDNASGLSGEKPEESYMVDLLYNCELFLYLGHGGGEQYLRASTMIKKRTDNPSMNLPPALLMGCSSGSFQSNGELEPTSNVFHWLSCGSPLVVSNLWDITDRDIDKFSLEVFKRWGLLPGNNSSLESICHAISQSRSTCILRYLNGAAPIVYGLPFYFSGLTNIECY